MSEKWMNEWRGDVLNSKASFPTTSHRHITVICIDWFSFLPWAPRPAHPELPPIFRGTNHILVFF